MICLCEIFVLLEKPLKGLFGGMVDTNLGDFIFFEVFWANNLVVVVLYRFFQTGCAYGVSAFESIRKIERRTEPIGTESALELIDMEDFHIIKMNLTIIFLSKPLIEIDKNEI